MSAKYAPIIESPPLIFRSPILIKYSTIVFYDIFI
jgi:hypothetical protein